MLKVRVVIMFVVPFTQKISIWNIKKNVLTSFPPLCVVVYV